MRGTIWCWATALMILGACKVQAGFEKKEVEKVGAELFEQVTGVKPDSFTCPGDERIIGEMTCVARAAGADWDVKAVVSKGEGLFGDGDMNITIPDVVVGKRVEEKMMEQYPAQKVPMTAVKCPPLVKLADGAKFQCQATIEGDAYPIEVSLTADGGWNSKILEPGAPPAPAPAPAPPAP